MNLCSNLYERKLKKQNHTFTLCLRLVVKFVHLSRLKVLKSHCEEKIDNKQIKLTICCPSYGPAGTFSDSMIFSFYLARRLMLSISPLRGSPPLVGTPSVITISMLSTLGLSPGEPNILVLTKFKPPTKFVKPPV